MTPQERLDAAWLSFVRDAGLPPDSWPSQALYTAWLSTIIATIEEERAACAKILHEVYRAWIEGDYSPGEAFESAREKILHGKRPL